MSRLADLFRRGALALALACVVLQANGAHAHAVLVESVPADGAALDGPAAEIVLRFNEIVNPGAFRLIGPQGEQRDLGRAAKAADRVVRIPLPRDLPRGSYLFSWRVVSADSHPIGGTLAFAFGSQSPGARGSAEAPAGPDSGWQLAAMVNRLVGDAALLFVAGAALFAVLVLRGRVPAGLPLARASAWAGAVGFVSLIGAIGITGGWVLGAPPGALLNAESWRAGLATNALPRSTAGLAGIVMAAAAIFALPARAACAIAVGGALISAGSLALSGHVAGLDPAWPAQLALALHAAAVAFWIGSLWPLHVIVRTHPAEAAAIIVRRFSAIAVPAVAVLAIAGVGVALTRLRSFDALVATTYGRILLCKLAFVAMMVAVAVRNRRKLTPTLAAGQPGADRMLARNIRIEIGLAGIVLLLTAILGHTSPGEAAGSRHEHDAHSGLSVTAESRGHRLNLEITPGHRGINRIVATVTTPSGQPLAAPEVTAAFALPDAGIEPLLRPMRPVGAGIYAIERVELPIAGRWHVQIDVLVSDFEKLTFAVELTIQ